MKQKSQRQLQIGENIKRILSDVFMREDILSVPGCYITVLEADVSPDAKNVKVFIDIFGKEELHDKILNSLNKNSSHFRAHLAKKAVLRTVPEIVFILDKSGKKATDIESLIASEGKRYQNNEGDNG